MKHITVHEPGQHVTVGHCCFEGRELNADMRDNSLRLYRWLITRWMDIISLLYHTGWIQPFAIFWLELREQGFVYIVLLNYYCR
jgi:hypothetical protein